jgi:DNA replication protein DnaC
MIEERDRILADIEESRNRKKAKYTCFICGKGDLDWNTVLGYSYVYTNKGTITRLGHVYTDIKLCSDECRKIAVPKYYDSYESFMEDVNIPKKFLESRLSNIHNTNMMEFYQNYVDNIDTLNKGLYLHGSIGCGKTYASCSIAYELRKRDKTVYFTSAQEMIVKTNNISYNNKEIEEFIAFYSKYDYLIIDDMDNITAVNNNAKSILFMLFSKIYNDDKKLIITSNFGIKDVFDHIDQRITSRISQILMLVEISDKDKRIG